MPAPIFIGDEVTAAAYRLAGTDARVTEPDKVAGVFGNAVGEAELVIITADLAAALPGDALTEAIRRADPLIVVVPDGGNRRMPQDLDTRVERVLGIEQ